MSMKILLTAALAAFSSLHFSPLPTMRTTDTTDHQDGFVPLFDGKTTKGWHTYNKSGVTGQGWKVEGGTIHLSPEAKKAGGDEGGDLITDAEFENFHLKYEWKISPEGNSGLIFYIHEDPTIANTYETGMEMQVLDNGTAIKLGHKDGRIYTHRAGDLYDLLAAKDAAKPQGQWNAAEIVSNRGKLEFYLNGQKTLSTTLWDANWQQMIAISKFKSMAGFGTYKKGRIGLQDHGDEVWYRNIRIKKL